MKRAMSVPVLHYRTQPIVALATTTILERCGTDDRTRTGYERLEKPLARPFAFVGVRKVEESNSDEVLARPTVFKTARAPLRGTFRC